VSRGVLLDTVGMIAVWDVRDQWHEVASAAFAALAAGNRPLYVTLPVLLECGNAAARHRYRRDVAGFRDEAAAAGRPIVPTDADVAQAWAAYDRGEAGDAGIVDQISFAVMRRLGLAEVFGNDGHFRAAGFVTLF
jgi:uncharacterized protein